MVVMNGDNDRCYGDDACTLMNEGGMRGGGMPRVCEVVVKSIMSVIDMNIYVWEN